MHSAFYAVLLSCLVLQGCGKGTNNPTPSQERSDIVVSGDVDRSTVEDGSAVVDSSGEVIPRAACPSGILTITPSTPTSDVPLQAQLDPPRTDVVFGWYDLTGSPGEALTQGFSLLSGLTVKNHTYEVRVASTTDTSCEVLRTSVTVINSAPVVAPSSVVVTPSAAYEDDVLSCSVLPNSTADVDDDPVAIGFSWLKNGEVLAGEVTNTLEGVFKAGDSVECLVTPSDDDTSGMAVASNTVLILNEPPETTLVTLECDTVDYVFCSALGADLEGSSLQFRYDWHIGASDCDDPPYYSELASEADGSTLLETPAKGVNVTCCATAIDESGLESSPVPSLPCKMANHPPTSPGADVSNTGSDASVTVQSQLICDAEVTDIDGDPVTKVCGWFIDGEPLAQDNPSCVLSDAFSKGQSICCDVTVSDGESQTVVSSKTCLPISDSPPVITSVSVGPENGDHCAIPTCSATATDVDGDDVSVNVVWYIGGQPTSQPEIIAGPALECVATPVADGVAGESVAQTVDFSNQPPAVESVTISSSQSPPTTESFISCQIGQASDPDTCDTLAPNISWVVNNEIVSTAAILSTELFSKGDTVGCIGQVSDGYEDSLPVFSDVLVIGDAPGSLLSVTVSPPVGNHKSIFTCNTETTDADGDVVSLTYGWYVDGVLLADKVGASISAVPVSQNPTLLTCAASVFTGDGVLPFVPSVNAASLTNALPIVTSVSVSPTNPITSDVLLCSATGSDADGDPVLFKYNWLIEAGGTTTSVFTDDMGTLPASATTLGSIIRCQATPTDGLFSGAQQTSLPVVVGNSAPSSESPVLTPSGGTPSTEFTCTGDGYFDPDGAEPMYEYIWFKNGQMVADEISQTWTPYLSGAVVGDTISCGAAPTDGTAVGEMKLSNPVVLTACAGEDGVLCDDNNACTSGDECIGGTCLGQPVDCSDGNTCTTDVCNPVSGCSQTANVSLCDDGNPCTTGDTCLNGGCLGETVNCEDDNPCTTSGCTVDTGCVQFAVIADCDDGDPCTVDDYCNAGSCQGGASAPCDDGNSCTIDYCALDTGCVSSPNDGIPCDDGNPCTAADTCSSGACLPGGATSCDDGNECTTDNCSSELGCTYGPVPIGKACTDNDPCTSGDVCENEQCVPGSLINCDDSNDCTADQCVSGSGCTYQNVDGVCADGVGVCLDGACCMPSCTAAECGSDGCGGLCGECALNEVCTAGQCVDGGEDDMVLVPQGDFLMGCNPDIELECLEDEMPQRLVTVNAFLIDMYETTVAEYGDCVLSGACTAAGDGFKCTSDDGVDEKPINCVSWSEADQFCAWEGKRLCTEAEWEKAARGVGGEQWPWGTEPVATCLHACLNDGSIGCGSGSPFPIGLYFNAVSPYGLYDVVGNVREWTADYYMSNYYQVGPTDNPTGVPYGVFRVARGGSFGDLAKKSRPSARDPMTPAMQADQVGIRCCKNYSP
ncbi:MAG: SUMF1/EgtB/PvdO family nonheme iron enzyme [Myxococcota bacterium]|nr:SUMF1/EgtB/PvdO family nonheme iron enzyme [Myxococcota bacterium]